MPELTWSLCDLDGNVLPDGALPQALAGGVTVPLSEGRTFDGLLVSMEDPACLLLKEGKTVVKAVYNGQVLVNGILGVPSGDFDAKVVSCSGRDSSVRALHRNLRYGHLSVTASLGPSGVGIPVDGTGFRMVLTDMDDGGGAIPKSGIQTGTDTVPAQLAAGTAGALYVKVTRGQLAWDVWQNMVDAAAGFDVDFRPVDELHPGAAAWAAGALCELVTVPRQGVDRSPGNAGGVRPVVFVHGLEGVHVVHAPDAFQMKNYAVQVSPGGQADPLDLMSKAGAFDHASWVKYGLFEDWQALGEELDPAVRQTVLTDRALAVVMANAEPPQFVTITCDNDTPGGMVFGTDFGVGDLVGVAASEGLYSVVLTVRIVQIKVVQKDANGTVALEIAAVPHRVDPAGIAFD